MIGGLLGDLAARGAQADVTLVVDDTLTVSLDPDGAASVSADGNHSVHVRVAQHGRVGWAAGATRSVREVIDAAYRSAACAGPAALFLPAPAPLPAVVTRSPAAGMLGPGSCSRMPASCATDSADTAGSWKPGPNAPLARWRSATRAGCTPLMTSAWLASASRPPRETARSAGSITVRWRRSLRMTWLTWSTRWSAACRHPCSSRGCRSGRTGLVRPAGGAGAARATVATSDRRTLGGRPGSLARARPSDHPDR